MNKILMIEDDIELASIIIKFLARYDHKVENAEDPVKGLEMLKEGEYELLILDLTLPFIDGLDLIQKIKDISSIPIIISSARDDIADKLTGFNRGADDYLPKPYNPRELEARIKSALRRHKKSRSKFENNEQFNIDKQARVISYKGISILLTAAEYDILKLLIEHKNSVVSRESIIYQSDFINDESSTKNINVMVSKIRSKILKIDPEFNSIDSVRGVGFTLKMA
jgi:two-component system OmpR family response regulator